MGKRALKFSVEKYSKTWKFNSEKFCGYICCDRMRKVFPISKNAIPTKNNGWLCDCGLFTDKDCWYHTVGYNNTDKMNVD
jgi:hypothetical protein